MKRTIYTLILGLFALVSVQAQSYETFGEKVKAKKAQDVAVLTSSQMQEGADITVKGEISAVCQMKGCWMKMELADGNQMRVSFKDYGFFVPKDLAGTEVIMKGKPEIKVTPVDELQHYAKDAGKSAEEIAAITEPKKELTFVADGVLVPKGR